MDLLEESSCPSESPLVRIVPMRPSQHGKPSNFSLLHKASRQSDGAYFSEDPPPASDSECRICLQGDTETLIKPCKCTGTVQFVHEGCLREWIRTKVEKGQSKVACELCQTEYNYQMEETKKFDCSQLLVSWRKHRRGVTVYLVLQFTALFLLGGLIALTVIAGEDDDMQGKVMPNQPVKLAYAAGIVLLSLFSVLIFALFVGQYCVRHDVAIKVRRYVPPRQRASVRSVRSIRKDRNSVVRV